MPTTSKKTASRCTTEAAHGTHVFEVIGYSLKRGLGVGKFVQSWTFTVGGYDWAIRFYPDGTIEASKDYVSVFLELMSKNAKVRVRYELTLLQHASGMWGVWWHPESPRLFKYCDGTWFGPWNPRFLLRDEMELEAFGYLRDDCLTIKCDLTVVKESRLSEIRVKTEIEVPPCDIAEHFAKLLDQTDGKDVTFSVGGDTFAAHKIVLAARSPVFKAQFYGKMRETRMRHVTIKGMQPAVFKALLHFIYTGSLHGMDNIGGDDYNNMIWHLLAAADRYAVDWLKLICQSILSKNLHVDTVATTLALADQHNCDRLKEVCIDFITSSKMDAVMATKGYRNLKRTCPAVLADILEKTSIAKLRRAAAHPKLSLVINYFSYEVI